MMDVSSFRNHRVRGKDGFCVSNTSPWREKRKREPSVLENSVAVGFVFREWRSLASAEGSLRVCGGSGGQGYETCHSCRNRADWLHLLWSCYDAAPLTPDEAMNEFMEWTVRDRMNGGTKNQTKNQRFGCKSLKARRGFIFEFICCFKNTTRGQRSVKNPTEATQVTLILIPNPNLTDRTLFFPLFHVILHVCDPDIYTWRLPMCSLCMGVQGTSLVSLCLVHFSLH